MQSRIAFSLLLLAAYGCSSSSSSPSPAVGSPKSTPLGCPNATPCTITIAAGDTEDRIANVFATATPGETIQIAAGTFTFTNELVIPNNDVSVVGAGKDKTILDFSGQLIGSEGLFAESLTKVRFEGFTVKDTKGNGIKVLGSTGVVFRDVRATWTTPNATLHGAYGLYPVQSKNVLVEGCTASGASDSGLYIGQSDGVVVRKSEAFGNVAGIEIENTFNADVYENDSHDNTGGLLVFDLPNLQQLGGHGVRVHDNKVHDNNTANFAPVGNIVGVVPAGVGSFVMANHDVEVFGNTFTNNHTANMSVISYLITQIPISDPMYYPYPASVYVHDNTFVGGGDKPDDTRDLGKLLGTALSSFPDKHVSDVLYDGITDPMKGMGPNSMKICVHQPVSHTVNLHMDKLDPALPALYSTMQVDPPELDCTLPSLPAVSFPGLTP